MTVASVGTLGSAAAVSTPWFELTVPRFLALLVAHALLGSMLPSNSLVATVLAWMVVILGVAISWRKPSAGPYCALYIVGFELLWRMASANIWWEAGKYGAALALLLSIRHRFKLTPVTAGAISYFLLLLPACALTFAALGPSLARTRIAFNLSGPFLVAVAITAFSLIPLEEVRPQRLLAFLVLPIAAVAARVGWFTLQAEDIVFEVEANFATTAGYGPNQVSTILGAGALGLVLLGSQASRRSYQLLFYGLAGLLFFQGVLTFSRGGVGAFVLGLAAIVTHLTVTPRRARGYLVAVLAVAAVLWFVVLPRADVWTGGKLAERFTSFESTGRSAIASQDLQLFQENPILGVGVGMAPHLRPLSHFGAASHTEFTRVLSEHGVLGALSMAILLVLTVVAYLRAPTVGSKAWTSGMLAWSIGNMATASLRLAASATLLGLAFISFDQLSQGHARRR